MDYLFLGLIFAVAVVYLYYAFFKKKGCGCGCKGCSVSEKVCHKSEQSDDIH